MFCDFGEAGFGFGAIRQMPNEMSEMRVTRLRQRLMNGLHRPSGFGLELEAVDVDLRPGQQLEAHGGDENVVGTRPLPAVRSERGRVVHDPRRVFGQIEALSEWPLQ